MNEWMKYHTAKAVWQEGLKLSDRLVPQGKKDWGGPPNLKQNLAYIQQSKNGNLARGKEL